MLFLYIGLGIHGNGLQTILIGDLLHPILGDLQPKQGGQLLNEGGKAEDVAEFLRALSGVDLGDDCG